MSKYNVGDVVKLRDDLECDKDYGHGICFVSSMNHLKRKPVVIEVCEKESCGEWYRVEDAYWNITDEMIEGLWEECKEKQVTMKYKIGDRFRYKDEYNTYRIISCDEEAGKYITVEEKQVGSRAFDVCEEKNMLLERCNNGKNVITTIFENMNNNDNFPKQPLKLIDVLNMIAKGELKEGTKVRYACFELTYDNEMLINDKGDLYAVILRDMAELNAEVELIEPPCEHEWKDIETHRMGEGIIRRFRRCVKCGLEEVEECNVGADKTIEPTDNTKIEELDKEEMLCLTLQCAIAVLTDKLNEVINKVNAQTEVILAQRKDIDEIKEQLDY